MSGQLLPRLHLAPPQDARAVVIGGGATRSRTGLTGFAIESAHDAQSPTPGKNLRADSAERLKRAALGSFFPVWPLHHLVSHRGAKIAGMKRTPFFNWMVPDDITGKLRMTKYLMTEETARQRHGTSAVRIDPAVEWRDLPEPGDDTNHNRAKGHGGTS